MGRVLGENVLEGSLSSSFNFIERTSNGNYIVIGNSSNKYQELMDGQSGKQDSIIIKYNPDIQAGGKLVLQKIDDYHRLD